MILLAPSVETQTQTILPQDPKNLWNQIKLEFTKSIYCAICRERIERVGGICMAETFATFLQGLDSSNFAECSGKELLEREVLRIMRGEGFSDDQIYDMPLEKLLDLFYDTYLWSTNEVLSKSIVMDQKHLG